MANILTLADFDSGKAKVNYNSHQEGDFEAYITRYERVYLIELLGVELYNLLIADLVAGVPSSSRFLAIYNPIAVEISGENVTTRGIVEMLKGFIYFHWVRDNMTQQTTVGSKRTSSENATNISGTSALIQARFNDSVEDSRNVQLFIYENDEDYPEYNGKEIGYSLTI